MTESLRELLEKVKVKGEALIKSVVVVVVDKATAKKMEEDIKICKVELAHIECDIAYLDFAKNREEYNKARDEKNKAREKNGVTDSGWDLLIKAHVKTDVLILSANKYVKTLETLAENYSATDYYNKALAKKEQARAAREREEIKVYEVELAHINNDIACLSNNY